MDKHNGSDDDFEFVGYVSWVEECGLFFCHAGRVRIDGLAALVDRQGRGVLVVSREIYGTGGGFVYRAMKPEFCPAHYLPNHCFAFDLESDGGAWLDAPYYIPAGSTIKLKDGNDYWIASSHAWRDGGAP